MTDLYEPRAVEESALTLSQFMQPEHYNSLGTVHGGVLLKLCDECGGIIASRHARRPCVTVTVDSVSFLHPVHVGQLLFVHGNITYVGTSSIEIELRVEAEDLLTGNITHTNDAFIVYVALDDNLRPTRVPPLLIQTDDERQKFEEGKQRQAARLARKKPTT